MRLSNALLLILLFALSAQAQESTGADAETRPAPFSLALGRSLDHAALLKEVAPLPSAGLDRVLLSPTCDKSGTVLHVLDVASGEVRHDAVAGQVLALAWLDDRRYFAIRATPAAEVGLVLMDAQTGHIGLVEGLPPAPSSSLGTPHCGPDPASYRLWSGADEQGQPVLALAMRRGETQFEVRRYRLKLMRDSVAVAEKSTQMAGPAFMPAGHRLLGVVPSLSSKKTVLFWHNQPGKVPALQIDLLLPGAQEGGTTARTLIQANDDLQSCVFARGDRVLCHNRSGGRGFLLLVNGGDEGRRMQQLSRDGGAGAFVLSPDGRRVAYGATDGPVVVQDLLTGAQKQAALPETKQACESTAAAPLLFWPDPGHLLFHVPCAPGLHLISVNEKSLEPVVRTVEAPPLPVHASHRSGRAHTTTRRTDSQFWSPRY